MIKDCLKTLIRSSAIILSPLIVALIFWNEHPDMVPIHYNILGEADSYASKIILLFLPIILLIVQWVAALEYNHIMKKKSENADTQKKLIKSMSNTLAFTSCIISVIIFLGIFGQGLYFMKTTLPIVFGITFIILGNKAPKIPQNKWVGFRVKWTLDDKDNWMKTQRFFGWASMIGGSLVVLLSIFPGGEVAYTYMIIILLLIVFIPMGYSYKLYKNKIKE